MTLEQESTDLFSYLAEGGRQSGKSPEAVYSGWVRSSGILPEISDIPVLMGMIRNAGNGTVDRQLWEQCGEALS